MAIAQERPEAAKGKVDDAQREVELVVRQLWLLPKSGIGRGAS